MLKQIFNWLSGSPLRREDDCFGKMHFLEHRRKPELSYWECVCPFRTADNRIEVCVYGTREGPDDRQKAFFREVESRYSALTEAIIPLIEEEFRNWQPDWRIGNFMAEFTLVLLELPLLNGSAVWRMNFDTKHDPDHQFTIEFCNWIPQSVHVDG